jgi:integrase
MALLGTWRRHRRAAPVAIPDSECLVACASELSPHHVTADVDRPRRQPKELDVWSARQLAAFLDSCTDDRLFLLLQIASHPGARRSELLALRWTSVDLTAGTVSIASRRTRVGYEMMHRPGTKTAAGARVIDLDPTTIDVLRSWRKAQDAEREAWGVGYIDSGYVITAENGEPVHADHVANRYDRLVAAAPIPALHFHGLRYTHATLLLKAGVPVHVVAQRLGHSSPALTLSIYSHVLPRQQAAAAALAAKSSRGVRRSGRAFGDLPDRADRRENRRCGSDAPAHVANAHAGAQCCGCRYCCS